MKVDIEDLWRLFRGRYAFWKKENPSRGIESGSSNYLPRNVGVLAANVGEIQGSLAKNVQQRLSRLWEIPGSFAGNVELVCGRYTELLRNDSLEERR